MRIQLDELGRHVSLTDQEKEALVQRLEEARQSYESSASASAGVTEENGRLGQTVAQLAQQVEEYKGLLDMSGEESSRLQSRLKSLEEELAGRPPRNEDLETLKSGLEARAAELEASLSEKTAAAANLAKELEDQKNQLHTLQKENEQHKHHEKTLEDTTKHRLEHADKIQHLCEEQKLTIRQMKLDMDKHTAAFSTFQKSQADLQQRYNRSQIKVQELGATIAMLEQKLGTISGSTVYKMFSSMGMFPKKDG